MAAVGGSRSRKIKAETVEYWNGTAWTEQAEMICCRKRRSRICRNISCYAFAAKRPWPNSPTENFDWDGTNWTAGGTVNTGRYGAMGAGTLHCRNDSRWLLPPGANYSDTVELYNGSIMD